jgi:hypothetical protein
MTRFNNFDQYIQDSMASWHCPGVAVVVKEGDVLHQAVCFKATPSAVAKRDAS